MWWRLVSEGYLTIQQRLVHSINQRFGLSSASFDILLRLIRSPDHRMSMTQLAHEAALSSGGFTKLADRLIAADLVQRIPSSHDRRIVHIALTEYGSAVAKQIHQTCAKLLREALIHPLGPQRAEELADTMHALQQTNQDQEMQSR